MGRIRRDDAQGGRRARRRRQNQEAGGDQGRRQQDLFDLQQLPRVLPRLTRLQRGLRETPEGRCITGASQAFFFASSSWFNPVTRGRQDRNRSNNQRRTGCGAVVTGADNSGHSLSSRPADRYSNGSGIVRRRKGAGLPRRNESGVRAAAREKSLGPSSTVAGSFTFSAT